MDDNSYEFVFFFQSTSFTILRSLNTLSQYYSYIKKACVLAVCETHHVFSGFRSKNEVHLSASVYLLLHKSMKLLTHIIWIFQAEMVRDAAWGCDWVGTPVSFQRCLVFIIASANKEFTLTAGKFLPVSNKTMMNVRTLSTTSWRVSLRIF